MTYRDAFREFRRRYLMELLELYPHKPTAAAKAAVINRTHLYKMIRREGIAYELRARKRRVVTPINWPRKVQINRADPWSRWATKSLKRSMP